MIEATKKKKNCSKKQEKTKKKGVQEYLYFNFGKAFFIQQNIKYK